MNTTKKSDLQIILWFIRPYHSWAVTVFVLLFVYAVLDTISIGAFYPFVNKILAGTAGPAQYSGRILDYLDRISMLLPVEDKLIATSLFLLIVIVASRIFGILSDSIALWYHLRLYADVQNKIYEKILMNQFRYFHQKKQGELMYIGREASLAVGEIFFYFPKAGVEIFRVIILSILLLSISVKFTLLTYVIIAIFGLIVHLLTSKVINPAAEKAQVTYSNITSIFSESISGIRQIKLLDNYKFWFTKFMKETDRARALQFKYTAPQYFQAHLILSVGAISTVLTIIYVKLYMAAQFVMVFPIIVVFVGAMMKLMPSIKEIAHQWMGLKGLAPRLHVTYETLSDQEHIMDDGKMPFTGLKEEIKINNLSFSYPTREGEVLQNISIGIPKGQTVAIVGESGSGKSTLADLLVRLYVPVSGKITVDGTDYLDFSRSSWLNHLGMVSQDTFVFHASIKDNIRIGKLDATDDEVTKAARVAHIDQFIDELPEGYSTITGDRGVKLSGGQRQRIALARALVRDPEILILDEATSSLDNISEKLVQDAIRESRKARTTIIIAHRLTTIEHADRIFVLDQGNLVEEGTHKELLERNGFYYRLYQRQKDETSQPTTEGNS